MHSVCLWFYKYPPVCRKINCMKYSVEMFETFSGFWTLIYICLFIPYDVAGFASALYRMICTVVLQVVLHAHVSHGQSSLLLTDTLWKHWAPELSDALFIMLHSSKQMTYASSSTQTNYTFSLVFYGLERFPLWKTLSPKAHLLIALSLHTFHCSLYLFLILSIFHCEAVMALADVGLK